MFASGLANEAWGLTESYGTVSYAAEADERQIPRPGAPAILIMALPPPPGLPASSAAARAGRVPKSETRNPKPEGNPRSEI